MAFCFYGLLGPRRRLRPYAVSAVSIKVIYSELPLKTDTRYFPISQRYTEGGVWIITERGGGRCIYSEQGGLRCKPVHQRCSHRSCIGEVRKTLGQDAKFSSPPESPLASSVLRAWVIIIVLQFLENKRNLSKWTLTL